MQAAIFPKWRRLLTDVIIPDHILTMSSREIAEICEARHNDVIETIKRLLDQGVLRESRKTTRTYRPQGGGRPTEVYDLTKRDTLVVVSGYNADVRAKIIDRWLELEAQSAQTPKVPQTYAAALLEAGRLALENERLTAEREALLPRAEALDRLSAADGSLSVTEAAKAIKVKPKTLFAWLSRNGWIYRRAGSARWLGYQAHTSNGDLEHKTTTVIRGDGSEKITEQVRVTAKGLTKLAKVARDIE